MKNERIRFRMLKSKRAMIFTLMLVLLTTVILTYAYMRLSAKMDNVKRDIGEVQLDTISTVQEGEKALIFVDLAAKFALYQAIYDLQERGGVADNAECGSYYGFNRWNSDSGEACFVDSASAKDALRDLFVSGIVARLASYPSADFVGNVPSAAFSRGEFAASQDVGAAPVEGAGWAWPAEGEMSGWWSDGGHTGLDISNEEGTQITAAYPGTVLRTSAAEDTPACLAWFERCGKHGENCPSETQPSECSMCGKNVVIRDSENRFHLYCHLSEVLVGPGDTVQACQKIGEMGATGNSNGADHLHYSLYQGTLHSGDTMNPLTYLNTADPSRRIAQSSQGDARHCGTALAGRVASGAEPSQDPSGSVVDSGAAEVSQETEARDSRFDEGDV